MNKNLKKKEFAKRIKGITLIALVITIIVLLILAGVSITMLTGNNSILQKATDAKTNTERKNVIELAQTEILGQIAENKGERITEVQLKAILSKYFEEFNEELPEDLSETTVKLTAKVEYGGYTNIELSHIYNGLISKETKLKSLVLTDMEENVEVTIYYDETVITWQDFINSAFSSLDWTTKYRGHGEYIVEFKGREVYSDSHNIYTDYKLIDYSDYCF